MLFVIMKMQLSDNYMLNCFPYSENPLIGKSVILFAINIITNINCLWDESIKTVIKETKSMVDYVFMYVFIVKHEHVSMPYIHYRENSIEISLKDKLWLIWWLPFCFSHVSFFTLFNSIFYDYVLFYFD